MDTDPTADAGLRRPPAADPAAGDAAAPEGRGDWVVLARPGNRVTEHRSLSMRRIVLQLVLGTVVVLILITIGGAFASRRLAEREAVNDSCSTANVLAEAVVQPALTDALLASDPTAIAQFNTLVRQRVLNDGVVRVKIWTAQGTVVYSDQAALIGKRFPLDDEESEALRNPKTVAEISDLDQPENALDRTIAGKLVEVYRPVWTSTGHEALFEIYTPYSTVSQRTGQLTRGFAGVTLSSLLLLVVLVLPIVVALIRQVRRAERQRNVLLQRAVDASAATRRRVAASLHDGPVQDLAATSYLVAGATASAEAAEQPALARDLRTVSGSVRASIRALRSLLVDIYPPSLADAGLTAALTDLAQSVGHDRLDVRLEVADTDRLDLDEERQRLVFRVAQEALRNAEKHAGPCTVTVTLTRTQPNGEVLLDIVDDGAGFEPATVVAAPAPGHFGLRLLADLVTVGAAELAVASAPGRGTHWRLRIPADATSSVRPTPEE